MKILTKLHLLSIGIVFAITASVLAVGTLIIDDILYRVQEQILQLELSNASQTVVQRLERSGVRAATAQAAALQAALRQKKGLKSVQLVIVERPDDRVVYHPSMPPGEKLVFDYIEHMFNSQQGSIEYSVNQAPYYAAYHTLPAPNWLFVLSIEKGEMLEKRNAFLRTIGVITFVILGLSALTFSIFGKLLIDRVRAALACVQRIEHGELSARIPAVTADDEIGQLQQGINAMGARIEQRTTQLQQGQARIRRLMDANIIGIFFWELTGAISEANDAFLHLLGYTQQDLQSGCVNWKAMTPAEYVAADAQALAEIKAGGTCRPYEKKFIRKDGTCLPVLVGGAFLELTSDQGVSFVLDLSAHKRAEERFRSVVEAMANALIMVNNQGRMELVNAQAERMFGYARSELLGRPIEMLVPQRASHHVQLRDQYFSDPQPRQMGAGRELYAVRKDGSEFPVEIGLNPVNTEQGVMVLAAIVDITTRKQSEEELARHRERLEELVAARTAELTIAKNKADVANKAKSTFLASMSHELRTPLNAVLGYAQILKRDQDLSERQMAGVNTIQQSGEHLLTLINDILDLAKIEVGKFELDSNAFNLPLFLRTVGDIIRVKAEEKSLLFNFDLQADLPLTVRADEKRLRQVLLNLLSNAVKYTDRGYIALRVQCLSGNDDRVRLRFEIEDSGIGIDADQQAMLFQPFTQVGDLERRSGGTGLGLTISRQLLRLMSSEIHVESQVHAGSLFWFEIEVPVADALTGLPAEQAITGYQGPRKSVLIVDDVLANRAMLSDLLSLLGFDTTEAAHGQEALQKLQTLAPDLIIMDMVMPVMNGQEAMRRIRQTPAIAALPIIAASASATEEDQARYLAAGANVFLPKPIETAHLLQQIGVLLDLTWEVKAGAAGLAQAANGPLVIPPPAELAALHALALAGNMHDILLWIERLVLQGEQYRPFAEKLRRLADGYQSRAILAMVDDCMERQAPRPNLHQR